MGIDESRSDQPPTKIDFGLPKRCSACRIIAADETDQTSVGDDGVAPAGQARKRVPRRRSRSWSKVKIEI